MRTKRSDSISVIVGLHFHLPGSPQLYTKRVVCRDQHEFARLQAWFERTDAYTGGPSFHAEEFSIPENTRDMLVLVTLISDGQE